MASRIEGNVHVTGGLSAGSMTLPAGSVDNAKVSSGADIDASKLEHQHQITMAQENGAAAAAETRVVHVVYGTAGSLIAVQAGCETACVGDSTIDVDVHKNGSSILTAAIELSSSEDDYELVDGVIDSATLAADDVIEVVISVTAGTGTLGEGVFCNLVIREGAA